MFSRWLCWTMMLGLVGGCSFAVQQQVDCMACELPNHPLDVEQLAPADQSTRQMNSPNQTAMAVNGNGLSLANLQIPSQDQRKPKLEGPKFEERLKYPADLPGANAPPIIIPGPGAPKEQREKAIDQLYPPLPPLGPEPPQQPGPNGQPLSLADLQNLARTNSPLLRQAAAEVLAARGAVIQVGAYPNPSFGYQADQVESGNTAGFQGLYLEQKFKTAGKLELARNSANMAWQNAQVTFRRAQSDVATQVRNNYFAVLVSLENVKISRAVARFTDQVYQIQVDQLKFAGIAAPYEPMQLRVQAIQARANLVLARDRYASAWKQLAASLGLPGMKPTQLASRIDQPLPLFDHEKVLATILARHTDVLTAQNGIQKARYDLRLAQVTPVPDPFLHLAVEKDFSTPPFATTFSVQLGGPIPIYDRNQGNIIQAQGALMRAIDEPHRVRDDLTSRLASAFEQYENNRILLEYYRKQIIPDQVRTYLGVYHRYWAQSADDPRKVGFGDIVTAQQTLVGVITTYVTTLGQAWSSVVGVADLLQTNDLFQIGLEAPEMQPVEPVPDLDHLPILPCEHPCTTMPDPALKSADSNWPYPQSSSSQSPSSQSPDRNAGGSKAVSYSQNPEEPNPVANAPGSPQPDRRPQNPANRNPLPDS
jgi:cobalt-zinc-cadmium efflux system outer membrane protein